MPEGINPQHVSLRATGRFTPQEAGAYTLGLVSVGRSRLFIDGREVIDNWTQQTHGGEYFSMGSTEVKATVTLEAGREYLLTIEFAKGEEVPLGAVRLGCRPPAPADTIDHPAPLPPPSHVPIIFLRFVIPSHSQR